MYLLFLILAKWKLASRAAVITLNGSIGGGILGIAYSYIRDAEILDVPTFVTGVRGGLVSVTGICALARPWEGLVIGVFGGLFACLLSDAMIKLKIDDPVNCVSTHAGSGVWGMIAVALFVEQEKAEGFAEEKGLFKVRCSITVYLCRDCFYLVLSVADLGEGPGGPAPPPYFR